MRILILKYFPLRLACYHINLLFLPQRRRLVGFHGTKITVVNSAVRCKEVLRFFCEFRYETS